MTSPAPHGQRAAPSAPHPAAPHPDPADDLPHFLRFRPVPVKARRDGWSHALQLRFIVALARGASVAEAARGLGRGRQGPYALRRMAGAEEFSAAWDAAVDFARAARGAAASRGAVSTSVETLLVPRHYRGRLIGYVQREDLSGLMRRLGQLDRLAERMAAGRGGPELRALPEKLDAFMRRT